MEIEEDEDKFIKENPIIFKKYKVKNTNILHDGVVRYIGEIIELDEMLDTNQNGYSGDMMYRNEPMWDRRYSGNSYHGQYTIATGDGHNGYSGRNMRRSYSRGDDARMELEEMLNNTRDPQEAETLRKVISKL